MCGYKMSERGVGWQIGSRRCITLYPAPQHLIWLTLSAGILAGMLDERDTSPVPIRVTS
jgi:hypothetical protein